MNTTVAIISIVIIIIIIIIVIVRFVSTWFFLSVHGCKGSYLVYLSNWTTGLSFYGRRGSLFFFLRPASFLDIAMDPQYNMTQFKQIHFIHICNSLLQDSEISWINSVLRRIQFQSWRTSRAVGGSRVLTTSGGRRTTKPVTTNSRREDYVRLPFVDDLRLRSAMQDFLRRKPSSEAKLTGRQIKSS